MIKLKGLIRDDLFIATWVGGGYINGTAEMVLTSGVLWCQAPFGYSLSLVFGKDYCSIPVTANGPRL